ncbi:MAG: antibiotic ABC transporter ATP-binding protein [Alphaproteobacteria bacterium 16-39-46]|nr:MAG: antibiotic ABC transporter ATP-binding protein [Alphaproteobacteria bacterium 16-39-46]OZA43746.1 MAG: antibiotic ABC transporter ATP-binding protein [Alphaproteobacteria bacterium 17-39-52]HQS83563.1 ATP-binding cassette domain-containing protein [Alphaproteobacteria bacterium]HQS93338.1 ATP-binding cassette domain-containing protein [Alphaproteobacteria bacterium]
MTQKPIQLQNLTLSFPHKVCFEDFSAVVPFGSRIGIIGSNGSGKSCLLKIIQGGVPADGFVKIPENTRIGYVPQVIDDFFGLSGGQRLNAVLTQVLSLDPDVLLLDEPTNHLDLKNRKSLMRLLGAYRGTLIVVSHDVDLLRQCCHCLWHIDAGKIRTFSGGYDDYQRKIKIQRDSLEQELSILDRQKKETHISLMKEQTRASKSRSKGEKSIKERKWPTIVSNAKAPRAEETSGVKKSNILHKKEELNARLSELRLPEIIRPTFSINACDVGRKTLVSISDGSVGYENQEILLKDINLSLFSGERLAILGDNGSGKSTLIKAILGEEGVKRSGNWSLPNRCDIGYLDQHYGTLCPDKSVLETIQELIPMGAHGDLRRHLNEFLFRKNEEVHAQVSTLSGGEKVRLTLAQIASKTPKLLILDEITNNLDLEARDHVIEVLKAYPGAMIVISHDVDFLKEIGIHDSYQVAKVSYGEAKS